ncbi:probable cyclic nucleotide-gated ion channel 14 [Gossypium arboreum]|uniref:probable cyclic nucleotide-gated ion channel 14 n=1 Tax=Gossypium arboreum TaxID=29729 RepID=UPI0008196B49|nr:probable cyclic nucleotide-gated ion channel 14 [Gossypium arboreum]
MESKMKELVRFNNNGSTDIKKPVPVYKATVPLLKTEGGHSDSNSNSRIPKFGKFKVFPEDHEPRKERILDPGSETFLQWNRIFLFWCLVALFVDPLFFYMPSVINKDTTSCMDTDLNLGIIVTCFRTLADAFYALHIIIKFRTAYESPNSRVFRRGELVTDLHMIASRYLKSDFFIDLLAALPLPQIMIWFIIPATRSSHGDYTNNALVLIVLVQYVPRLYLIFPLSSQIIKNTGVVTKTAWAGAAYNLLLYMLASHVLGASWYLLSVERHVICWKSECKKETSPLQCNPHYLDCGTLGDGGRRKWENGTVVFTKCHHDNDISFDYGIFEIALTKQVLSSSFLQKYFYCLWWGLQNLSSYGQALNTSTFVWETLFAILIAILGLVLFAHLIGNMQTYLQSITVRLEEWRLKRRDTEEWMRHRQLPQDLRERVQCFVQYKWLATRGVDEESILRALPPDLRRDIQRHLCLDLVRRVPFFSQMDDQLLDAICERLVSSLSTQGTYIVREGDPVTEMLFIIRGRLESCTTNGGRTGFFNSINLRPGDFCGEELLSWALLPKSSSNLPSSTRTVRTLVEVEAFVLRAEDLKFVANQFRRLHSKKLQHTFRYHSYHWRTWGACFIQAAWRRHVKRTMARNLSVTECDQRQQGEEHSVVSSKSSHVKLNLGVTILASKFAANTRRGAQRMKDVEMPKLQKPLDPDFSAEPDDE